MATENINPLVGVGAPENNDWETDDFDIKLRDQSFGLPDCDSVTLYRIKPQLTCKADFDAWENAIILHLTGARLKNLIEVSIDKPMRNSTESMNWMNLSKKVLSWLCDSINPDLNREIVNGSQRKKHKWADTYMDSCRKFFRGEGFLAISHAQERFFEIKYNDFDNAKDYVAAVKQRYETLQQLGGCPTPYDAIALIHRQLKKVKEWESFIMVREGSYQKVKDPKNNMTENDLYELIGEIQESASEETGYSNIATAKNRTKNPNRLTSQEEKKGYNKLTNAPPKGKGVHQHVRDWKNQKAQRQRQCGDNHEK